MRRNFLPKFRGAQLQQIIHIAPFFQVNMQLNHTSQSSHHIAGHAFHPVGTVVIAIPPQQNRLGGAAGQHQPMRQFGLGGLQIPHHLADHPGGVRFGYGRQPSVLHQIPQGNRRRADGDDFGLRVVFPAAGHHLHQKLRNIPPQLPLPLDMPQLPQPLGNAHRQNAFDGDGVIVKFVPQPPPGIGDRRIAVFGFNNRPQSVRHTDDNVGAGMPAPGAAMPLRLHPVLRRRLPLHRLRDIRIHRLFIRSHNPIAPTF